MKLMKVMLVAAVLTVPWLAGCQENERKIERRETIRVESEPQMTVQPDAAQP